MDHPSHRLRHSSIELFGGGCGMGFRIHGMQHRGKPLFHHQLQSVDHRGFPAAPDHHRRGGNRQESRRPQRRRIRLLRPGKRLLRRRELQGLGEHLLQHWEDGGDGYRYLKTALAPGLESPPVCTQVVISPDASKAQIRDFNVIAFCETTPTKGRNGAVYSNAQEAFTARKESR